MGGIFNTQTMETIFNPVYKVSSAKQKPDTPRTREELTAIMKEGLRDGSWQSALAATIRSSPMSGTAGGFGGPVSVAINHPTDDAPQSLDPMGHLKADVRYLGTGLTPPLSKDEKEYEIAKAVRDAAIEADPVLAKMARARWSGGEIAAVDEAQLKSAITRLLAQRPELARELKVIYGV